LRRWWPFRDGVPIVQINKDCMSQGAGAQAEPKKNRLNLPVIQNDFRKPSLRSMDEINVWIEEDYPFFIPSRTL